MSNLTKGNLTNETNLTNERANQRSKVLYYHPYYDSYRSYYYYDYYYSTTPNLTQLT